LTTKTVINGDRPSWVHPIPNAFAKEVRSTTDPIASL
jgi:hypothetical protein